MSYKGHAFIYTIGCQMNVYDSEKLAYILASSGYEKTDKLDEADIVVCNTCSIRHKAEEKAFSFLGRFAKIKKEKPGLITVMAGCVAQQEGAKAFNRLPHLNIVLGTRAFSRFAQHIAAIQSGQSKITDIDDSPQIFDSPPFIYRDAKPDNFEPAVFPDKQTEKQAEEQAGKQPEKPEENQVSRFVTIMQGCENFCTYCVVPYVRGKEKSRKAENILKEVQLLADSGVKEVTLLGQNVNSYGRKEGGTSFPELLSMLNQVKGIHRIRFATSHPKDLSSDLIYAIRDLKTVCRHLHLPVQSGSNAILKKMNRRYTREDYLERIKELRHECPDISLSTDLIVGFPSETVNDFRNTLDLLRIVEFDSIFAFAYSKRSSTPAASFPDQVDEKEKLERLNHLLKLQETYTEKKNSEQINKTLEILVTGTSTAKHKRPESHTENMQQMTGRTVSNKIVHFLSDQIKIGDLARIKITNAYPHSLWGVPYKANKE